MFARTKRLTLRPGWPEETDALTRTFAGEQVSTRLARLTWPCEQADAEASLAPPRGPHDPRFFIMAHGTGHPQLVGGIGLTTVACGVAEFGCWLTPSARGRGFATEAGRAVIDMARHALPLRRVEASCRCEQPAARRVLDKLGFREARGEPRVGLYEGGPGSVLLALELRAPVALAA